MNPKLSVIVPVYNTLPFLQSCFDSIKRQDYSPLEVIIVDDGSTDGSGRFCDEYATKDKRFFVIHKDNGGSSSARNAGIEASTGELITFIDSDDALLGQPYINLIDLMVKNNVQIIGMNYFHSDRYPNKDVQSNQKISLRFLDNLQFYRELCNQTISDAVWDKIFDKSLFCFNIFKQDLLNEDFFLLIQMAQSQIKVAISDYLGYFYYRRKGSITGSGFKKNMIDALHNADYASLHAPDNACKKAAEEYLMHKILMFMVNMPKEYIKGKNEEYIFAKKKLNEINVLKSNRSIRDKMLLVCFKIVPYFTNRVCSFYLSRGKKKV